MRYKDIKKSVLEILLEEPKARSCDTYLIYRYLKVNNLPTNIIDLIDKNVSFESITRARRILQNEYPILKSNEYVSQMRKELYDQIKADSLGVKYD